MEAYRLIENYFGPSVNSVRRFSDMACVPFDPRNSDFQRFKSDILDGAELQDVDGNVMSPEDAIAFVESLP